MNKCSFKSNIFLLYLHSYYAVFYADVLTDLVDRLCSAQHNVAEGSSLLNSMLLYYTPYHTELGARDLNFV